MIDRTTKLVFGLAVLVFVSVIIGAVLYDANRIASCEEVLSERGWSYLEKTPLCLGLDAEGFVRAVAEKD